MHRNNSGGRQQTKKNKLIPVKKKKNYNSMLIQGVFRYFYMSAVMMM